MKKKMLSFVSTGVIAVGMLFGIALSSEKSAASPILSANISALNSAPGGKCTGPKVVDCECTNTNPCSDLTGCSSTSTSLSTK